MKQLLSPLKQITQNRLIFHVYFCFPCHKVRFFPYYLRGHQGSLWPLLLFKCFHLQKVVSVENPFPSTVADMLVSDGDWVNTSSTTMDKKSTQITQVAVESGLSKTFPNIPWKILKCPHDVCGQSPGYQCTSGNAPVSYHESWTQQMSQWMLQATPSLQYRGKREREVTDGYWHVVWLQTELLKWLVFMNCKVRFSSKLTSGN